MSYLRSGESVDESIEAVRTEHEKSRNHFLGTSDTNTTNSLYGLAYAETGGSQTDDRKGKAFADDGSGSQSDNQRFSLADVNPIAT